MDVTGGLAYTKALWTVISGTHLRATSEVVRHEIEKSEELFVNGLRAYRPQNDDSDKKLEGEVGPQIFRFVIGVRKFLGIDALHAWDLLSNYLLYEFQGSEDGLQAFLVSEDKMTMLMTDIWMFYHSERLFLLKCINLVLSYCLDTTHPYQATFKEFVCKFRAEYFFSSLVSQLDLITNEPYPHRDIHGQLMTDQYQLRWQNYNLREQIEVLHNMIVYIDMFGTHLVPLQKFLQLCMDSRFGKQEEYKLRNTTLVQYYSEIIGFLQNILFLQCTNNLASSLLESGELPINIDDMINMLGDQEEHTPIILSWTLLKAFKNGNGSSADIFEKLSDLAVNSGAFEYLRVLMTSDILEDDSTLTKIVFVTVYDFVCLFANNFETETLGDLKGLLDLIGPLLKHRLIVDRFWNEDKGIKIIFWMLAERFPADYSQFISALDSLAACGPEHIPELMRLMMNTKCFGQRLFEEAHLLRHITENNELTIENKPMPYSDFILQPGTKGYFVDTEVFSWKCDFVVFEAIHNELRILVSQITSADHVIEPYTQQNAVATLNFLRNLLTSGVEMTKEVVAVVNYIFTLIAKLKTTMYAPTMLLALCLDITMVLLPKYPEEILKRLRLLDCLPTLHTIPKNIAYIFDGDYFSPKTIGTLIAGEECVNGEYPLLTTYLTFIYNLIKGEQFATTLEVALDRYLHIILPGLVFILGDVYPNYQSWHFVEERDHDHVALTCVKIFHELLNVNGTSKDPNSGVMTPLQLVQSLILFSFLNMKAGKILLKIVASGEAFIQTKMEKRFNWISDCGMSPVYLLQLSLSILNRVLLLKRVVQEKNTLSSLENDIYCSPKDICRVIPVVASYINNCFSSVLPVLAVKVLKRFALDLPKTLLACLGMEGDVLRDLIFRRLNSRIDSNRLKVALLQLVSACVDTQPGICDAVFNLPVESPLFIDSDNVVVSNIMNREAKPDFLRREPSKDNAKGVLAYVSAVLAKIQKEPELVTTPLYGACVDLICSLWIGENTAAIEYLRLQDKFWDLFCSPLFTKPVDYVYAFSQIFNIITLELFHYGKNVHPDLLANLERFFDEKNSALNVWSEFITKMFIGSKTTCEGSKSALKMRQHFWDPVTSKEDEEEAASEEEEEEEEEEEVDDEEEEPKFSLSQKMEKQPHNIQLLLSWKRFCIVALKLLQIDLSNDQKVVLTKNLMNALQHEIETMTLKPILLIVELYLVLVADWSKQVEQKYGKDGERLFFDNPEVVKDQIQVIIKSFASTYQLLPSRIREAILAFSLQAVDCLADQIKQDEIAAETILDSTTQIVLLELSDICLPENETKLLSDIEGEETADIILSLLRVLMPSAYLNDPSQSRESLSGRLSLSLLYKILKILIGNTLWLKNKKFGEIRSALLSSVGKTLHQLNFTMNMYHFNVAVNAINLIFFMIENGIVDSALDSQLPENLWLQLTPPRIEGQHWLTTEWVLIYKPALIIISRHLQVRTHIFLEKVIQFTSVHVEYIVDSILCFRNMLEPQMLELSMIALNFVRTLAAYPNHWRLCHDVSLTRIMQAVMTCLHICVILLINPSMFVRLVERQERKSDPNINIIDTETSPQIVTIHNQILKLSYLCLSILQYFCPRLTYLLTECLLKPIKSKPLLEPNVDTPNFDFLNNQIVPVSFGTLITLANICTQALSKGIRVPSPRPSVGSFRSIGVGSALISAMDKTMTSSVLEMCVEMITSQGLVYLLGDQLSSTDKELFRRSLNTEMTFFVEFTKRSIREATTNYTLETTLQALKTYLATTMNLHLVQQLSEYSLQVIKGRRLVPIRESDILRPSPPRAKLGKDTPSSSPLRSDGSKTSLSVSSSPEQSISEVNKDQSIESQQCDYHLPINEDFVNLVTTVFTSVFDVFNAGFDIAQ